MLLLAQSQMARLACRAICYKNTLEMELEQMHEKQTDSYHGIRIHYTSVSSKGISTKYMQMQEQERYENDGTENTESE
jgi:cytochrome c oxidase assembly protein Cox11